MPGFNTHAIPLALLLACVWGCQAADTPGSEWFVDPVDGRDGNDGRSPATPRRSLDFTQEKSFRTAPRTCISLKRGTVLRPGRTIVLRGHDAGWVTWGAYGTGAKPIVAGSAVLAARDWKPAGPGMLTADWSGGIDLGEKRSEVGVEQGPGNLWFFSRDAHDAPMSMWGWRRMTPRLEQDGDWFYDAPAKIIRLRWSASAPPPAAEASVNRTCLSFAGQKHVIVDGWDLRYVGGYVLRGHAASSIRLRNLDVSFSGGGTKNGQYVRLGNGAEMLGDVNDIVVEGCRFHQLYDTGMDVQDVGRRPVVQSDVVFRRNLVSHAGLAAVELWARTEQPGSRLLGISVTGNIFLHSGRGWGYEQHDHPGQVKCGADITVFNNNAIGERIAIRGNTFHGARMVLMSEWGDAREGSRALLRGADIDDNLWSYAGSSAVVLFRGTADEHGDPHPGQSLIFADLAAWQANTEAPGKDARSRSRRPDFVDPCDPPDQDQAWIIGAKAQERPTRFGAFALRGDYRPR